MTALATFLIVAAIACAIAAVLLVIAEALMEDQLPEREEQLPADSWDWPKRQRVAGPTSREHVGMDRRAA